MEILYILLVLLIATRVCSELFKQMGFPSILGEIIGGIILGLIINGFASDLPILSDLNHNEVFHAITELGIFFLMLFAGLELRPKEVKEASGGALWIAFGGMILPLALGLGLGWLMLPASDNKFALTLFIGVTLAITAVPVAIKILIDLGKLNTKAGNTIVSAAVIDDVVSLLILAVLTSIIKNGEIPGLFETFLLIGKILLFFAITIAIGRFLLPKVNKLITKNTMVDEMEISFLLVVAFAFSILAELLGMHFIMGAFMAGLFFVKEHYQKDNFVAIKNKIKGISSGFLAPVFFASIGLNLDLQALAAIPFFVLLLIVLATIGKLAGTMVPAKLLGFSKKESLMIGFSMNARGVVTLIIANIVLNAGLFNEANGSVIVSNLFSAVVIMAVVTTVLTPIALKGILK